MLIPAKLSEYLEANQVEWVPQMPEGIPPEDICVPDSHELYRLIQGDALTEEDLITYYEKDPLNDWGDKLAEACSVSMFNDLSKVGKLTSIPSLKSSRGVSKLTLNASDGVVKQTFKQRYHYSWWKTTNFDINSAETVMVL